ncbi:MAG: penicillin-binding protein 2 [Deltaproteobacteria bacterium]|nr:penicillin-binding protein 2 [Deltaproteobacteria bacterium]
MSSTIHSSKEPAYDAQRFRILFAMVCLACSILVVRIWWLQVKDSAHYSRLSASNFLQERRIPHRRGLIFDTQGKILVDNRASHDLHIIAAFLPDSLKTLRKVFRPLHLESARMKVLDKRLLAGVSRGESELQVATNIEKEECQEVIEKAQQIDAHGVFARWKGKDDDEKCDIFLEPALFPSRASIFQRLQKILEIDDDDWQKRLKKSLRRSSGLRKFIPVLLVEDIGFYAYARIRSASSLGEFPGVLVQDSQRRRSLVGASSAHVLGFMNEMTQKEFAAKKKDDYHLGDRIGRRGVERNFEDTLHGKDGTRRVVVDAKGRSKGERWAEILLGEAKGNAPLAGLSLVLSLDADLQKTAEKAFLGKAGSVVAIEAKTGFVLAMASFPTFDPNAMTGRTSAKEWRRVLNDPLRPLTNKAIQEHYAPGSTFKAITAVAGLSHGKITPHTHKHCPGYFRLGRASWRCYNRGGHGSIALENALKKSCDTYFYSLGYEMGPEKLASTARSFGFGSHTGIPLDREIPGIMPDIAYYKKHFGAYTPGLVVNSSIGQGDVTVTPLQLAAAYAAIANGGMLYRPQIVRAVVDENGVVIDEIRPDLRWPLDVPEDGLTAVRRSLSFVTEKGGTASGIRWRRDMPQMSKWVREGGVVIGGKTGTAQVVRLAKTVTHLKPEDVDYAQRDHAWFVGFAPADDPEIVVVAMTEHGGFGGSMSAPVVAEVMRVYFERGRSLAIPIDEGRVMGKKETIAATEMSIVSAVDGGSP